MPDAVKAGDIIRAKAGTYQAFNFRRPFSGLQNCLQHLIILCKDADNYVTKTSLNKNLLKLGISKYKIMEELPEYLEKRLKEIE